MSRTHIDHRDLVKFAEDKVNPPKDKADEYRAQARRPREKLEATCRIIRPSRSSEFNCQSRQGHRTPIAKRHRHGCVCQRL
jgi:hypothetical protein